MNSFSLVEAPLSGKNLIEANAGTGKTYSLCFLYIRLLIEKQLDVSEILVTTFTVAATTELKSRLFESLTQIKQLLTEIHDNNINDNTDKNWLIWLKQQRQQLSDEAIEKLIRIALCKIDQLQVYSIDALALLLFHENTHLIDLSPPEHLLDNDQKLLKSALIEAIQQPPQAIEKDIYAITDWISHQPIDSLSYCLDQIIVHADKVKSFNDDNLSRAGNVIDLFENIAKQLCQSTLETQAAIDLIIHSIESGILNKTSYKIDVIQTFYQQINQPTSYQEGSINTVLIEKLSSSYLESKIKKGKANPFNNEPIFELFNQLNNIKEDYEVAKTTQKQQHLFHIAHYLYTVITAKKAELMSLTYQDIMDCVTPIANQIESPYKAQLVDEAQDLNQQQLQLFKQLKGHDQSAMVRFFVGDPKQAIYGFRNSDINTYLALRDWVDLSYLLDTNFRSTKSLNKSINLLFSGNPFSQSINYHPIKSMLGCDEKICKQQTPINLFELDKALFAKYIPQITANVIHQTLQQSIIDENGQKKTIKENDIAILVRTKAQGKKIQKALSTIDIPSVFMDGESIFETAEANYFRMWLTVLVTLNIKSIKSLMLSPLLGFSVNQLNDSNLVQKIRQQLIKLSRLNFSSAFYQFMHVFNVSKVLITQPQGSRKLSNWLQLFELCQQQQTLSHLSFSQLLDWLTQQQSHEDKEMSQTSKLRLNKMHAIRIMTMHKSKGLEFNIVCLPYADKSTKPNTKASLLIHKESSQAMMSFINKADFKSLIQKELMAEDIRLLYVALTRAKYQNIILIQEGSNQKSTNNKEVKATTAWQILNQNLKTDILHNPLSNYQSLKANDLNTIENTINQGYAKNQNDTLPIFVKTQSDKLTPAWTLSSFSRLHDESKQYPPYRTEQTLSKKTNDVEIPLLNDEQDTLSHSILLHLPAGPQIGTALHSAYEWLMAYRQNDKAFIKQVKAQLNHPALTLDLSDKEAKQLAYEINSTIHMPLAPLPFSLSDIEIKQQSIEMRFFLHLPPKAKQTLSHRFGIHQVALTASYLHGYIDYCGYYQGKYYIVDYKSNDLGKTASDYQQDNLSQVMSSHQYQLQALIYTLAICKWLNIKDKKSYLETIGGAIYLFIRGMCFNSVPNDNQQNSPLLKMGKIPNNTGIWYHQFSWDEIKPYLTDST